MVIMVYIARSLAFYQRSTDQRPKWGWNRFESHVADHFPLPFPYTAPSYNIMTSPDAWIHIKGCICNGKSITSGPEQSWRSCMRIFKLHPTLNLSHSCHVQLNKALRMIRRLTTSDLARLKLNRMTQIKLYFLSLIISFRRPFLQQVVEWGCIIFIRDNLFASLHHFKREFHQKMVPYRLYLSSNIWSFDSSRCLLICLDTRNRFYTLLSTKPRLQPLH